MRLIYRLIGLVAVIVVGVPVLLWRLLTKGDSR